MSPALVGRVLHGKRHIKRQTAIAMIRAQERARQLVETSQVLDAVDLITSLLCKGLDSLQAADARP